MCCNSLVNDTVMKNPIQELQYLHIITNYLFTDVIIISVLFTRIYELLYKEEKDRNPVYKRLSFMSPILILLSSAY